MKRTTGVLRIIHRYLGFFLGGIMAMYALSGIVMIFRETDFLKQEVRVERQLKTNLTAKALGRKVGIKDLKAQETEGDILYFEEGQYNKANGMAAYTTKELLFWTR